MALDNSELGSDEIDLELERKEVKSSYNWDNPNDWKDVRAFWRDFLADWEKQLYYPIMAKFGLSKAVALQIYINKGTQSYTQGMHSMMQDANNDDDEDDEKWKKQTS